MLKFLQHNDAAALYLPWRVVYYDGELTEEVISHELIHDRQRLRDGAVLFSIKYLFWAWKYGYRDNPYEDEAYGSGHQSVGEATGEGAGG